MTEGVKTIMYPVKDLARAKTLYGKFVRRRHTRHQACDSCA